MSTLIVFLKSVLMGFAIAAPVGPIGILCIRNVLSSGFLAGIASGFGAALADSVYGIIAALGIGAITTFFISKISFLKFFGGFFLVYLGIKEFFSKKDYKHASELPKKQKIIKTIFVTFFLTITNPMTILSFISIFPSLAGNICCSIMQSTIMVTGIFVGSMFWWVILCGIVKYMHSFLPEKFLNLIAYISGTILVIFGSYSLISVLIK